MSPWGKGGVHTLVTPAGRDRGFRRPSAPQLLRDGSFDWVAVDDDEGDVIVLFENENGVGSSRPAVSCSMLFAALGIEFRASRWGRCGE